ncbi:DUF3043 domain-containing protein [Bifidobacterium sp. ESL0790]|uniref:DUF3043 domain-containing protein n=1 Tax=Bifidobacterium sp. ESL0790 TaxID=2983233 RepID=UPI0023F97E40|nr:DUF3043 domain-containing protein [Bifidobacterium sp. ESL0790]WEV71820.1 DUF3043 domain-containing protein [Bifidobacterium sp. ESL0790]
MTWNPFNKDKKQEPAQEPIAESKPKQDAQAGKGRPTPKRKVAQDRNLHPLVPKDRKADAKANKKRVRAREDREYDAMRTGDLSHMPKSEQLPWRVYIRDYVDARFNIAEYFIPVVFGAMILGMLLAIKWPALYAPIIGFSYIYLIIAVVDIVVMWYTLKKKLIDKFGKKAVAKGSRSCSYAWGRAIQLRRWRVPKPTSKKRGNWPK